MKKLRFQKLLRLIVALMMVIYPFSPLSNNLSSVNAADFALIYSVGEGGGGTVSATANGSSVNSGTSVAEGANVVVTFTPNPGYAFKNVEGASSGITNEGVSFTMPAQAVTLNVFFQPTYALSFEANPTGGTVLAAVGGAAAQGETPAVSGDAVQNGAQIPEGTRVTCTATPKIGYTFNGFTYSPTVQATVSGNEASFSMPAVDTIVTASFTAQSQTLTTEVSPTGGGTITGQPEGSVANTDTPVTLTATPSEGYQFDYWIFSPDVQETYSQSGNNEVTFNMPGEATTATAYFAEIPTYALTGAVSPEGTGTVSGQPTEPLRAGAPATLTATPAEGYIFGFWTFSAGGGDGVQPDYVRDGFLTNVLTLNMPDMPLTVTANFNEIPTYALTVAVDPEGSGTITGQPEGPIVEDTSVTLTATPAYGYAFDHWTFDFDGDPEKYVTGGFDTNTLSLTMPDMPATVTAHFTKLPTYALTVGVDPTGSGTISGQPTDPILADAPITLTATPADGYTFDHWAFSPAVKVTYSGNEVYFTMPAEATTATAYFTEIPTYTLDLKVYPTEGGIIRDANNNVVVPGSLQYASGSKINFTAEPKDGYIFKEWTGDYISDREEDNIQFSMPEYGVKLTAVFEKEKTATSVKTSDELNICPYITAMMLSGALYFLLKIPVRKAAKR